MSAQCHFRLRKRGFLLSSDRLYRVYDHLFAILSHNRCSVLTQTRINAGTTRMIRRMPQARRHASHVLATRGFQIRGGWPILRLWSTIPTSPRYEVAFCIYSVHPEDVSNYRQLSHSRSTNLVSPTSCQLGTFYANRGHCIVSERCSLTVSLSRGTHPCRGTLVSSISASATAARSS